MNHSCTVYRSVIVTRILIASMAWLVLLVWPGISLSQTELTQPVSAGTHVGSAEAKKTVPTPNLKPLQGHWTHHQMIGNLGGPNATELGAQFFALASAAESISIHENLWTIKAAKPEAKQQSTTREGSLTEAAITIDFSGSEFTPRIKQPTNGKPIMFTLKNGKPIFASYDSNEYSLTIRYPAGCCSRSGNVLTFVRVPSSKATQR